MRDAGCGMRDAGCGMRDAGCGMRDAGCGMRDARTRPGGEVDGSCGSGYRLGGRTAAGTIRTKGINLYDWASPGIASFPAMARGATLYCERNETGYATRTGAKGKQKGRKGLRPKRKQENILKRMNYTSKQNSSPPTSIPEAPRAARC